MTNHSWILGFSKIWFLLFGDWSRFVDHWYFVIDYCRYWVKIEIWWWPAGGRWQRWQRSRVQSRKLSTNGGRQPQKKSADFSGACTFHTNVHFCRKIHNICTCVRERGITIFGFFFFKKIHCCFKYGFPKGHFLGTLSHRRIDVCLILNEDSSSVSMEMKATHLPPMQAWLVFKVQKRRTNLLILWSSSMTIYHLW